VIELIAIRFVTVRTAEMFEETSNIASSRTARASGETPDDVSSQNRVQLNFYRHDRCKTEELAAALDFVDKPEYIHCGFPKTSYIGNILSAKYPKSDYDPEPVAIVASDISPTKEQLIEYQHRLSFQYLDKRIIFSDAKYQARFEKAVNSSTVRTDYEQDLIESTAIAYRLAWGYYRSKSKPGIWTF
jgi:hypothetical protein